MASDYPLRNLDAEPMVPRAAEELPIGHGQDSDLVSPLLLNTRVTTISESNSLQSPLLRLPPELRNHIYCYVLGGMDILIRCQESQDIHVPDRVRTELQTVTPAIKPHTLAYGVILKDKTSTKHVSLAQDGSLRILRVCRQLYHECATLVYALNTFHFATETALKVWHANRTPEQLGMVRTVRVDIGITEMRKQGQYGLGPLTVMFPELNKVIVGRAHYDLDFSWPVNDFDFTVVPAEAVMAAKEGEREGLEVVWD